MIAEEEIRAVVDALRRVGVDRGRPPGLVMDGPVPPEIEAFVRRYAEAPHA